MSYGIGGVASGTFTDAMCPDGENNWHAKALTNTAQFNGCPVIRKFGLSLFHAELFTCLQTQAGHLTLVKAVAE